MLKQNWPEVAARYRAFWNATELDRPPVVFDTIGLWQNPMYHAVGYDYTKYGEDIAAFCRDYRAVWDTRADVPDDTVPCIAPQYGGAYEAALLAGDIAWGTEVSTLTPYNPLADSPDLRTIHFQRNNPYFTRIQRELAYLAGESHGDFGINVEAGMSITTTISQLCGGTQFMYGVMDRPDEVRALAEEALKALLGVQAKVLRYNPLPDGTAHRWLNYWHPGTGFWFSEDDAVMLSAEMYRDLFLDLDIRLCVGVDIAVAHWHTAGLHLLPVLLDIPNLRMIQLSFDPNGPEVATVLHACRPFADSGRKLCFQTGYSTEFVAQAFKVLPAEACMFCFASANDAADAARIIKEVATLAKW